MTIGHAFILAVAVAIVGFTIYRAVFPAPARPAPPSPVPQPDEEEDDLKSSIHDRR